MSLSPQTPASTQAYLAILPKLPRRRLEVYQAVAAREPRGATLRELSLDLADAAGRPRSYHLLSPRISELVERGWLVESGEQRDGLTVYRVGDGSTPKARSRRARSKPIPAQVMGITTDALRPGESEITLRFDATRLLAAPVPLGERVVLLVPRV